MNLHRSCSIRRHHHRYHKHLVHCHRRNQGHTRQEPLNHSRCHRVHTLRVFGLRCNPQKIRRHLECRWHCSQGEIDSCRDSVQVAVFFACVRDVVDVAIRLAIIWNTVAIAIVPLDLAFIGDGVSVAVDK